MISPAYCVYGSDYVRFGAPQDKFPEKGMPSVVAHRIILDEMNLDGNPAMNLASFVTTYMEPEADDLIMHGTRKNAIDQDEYPQTRELGDRCINMLADLFKVPDRDKFPPVGCPTVGSSEAIMLAGLAMKWRWRAWAKEKGRKDWETAKPNVVFGANAQVCWFKMCKYFEVEPRAVAVTPDCLVLTAESAKNHIDENTIGVCPILGSTINGEFEDVKAIHSMVSELNEKNGWDVPLHVDAASGGFIAPFISPEIQWDFELPLVRSINVSGHKFGLAYAGIGWILFRSKSDLPDDLTFNVNYLGGDQSSFTLNFSRGASGIISQYYMLIRLGLEGYKAIMQNGMEVAKYLRHGLLETGRFRIVDKAHMPLVAFTLTDIRNCTVFDLQDRLRSRGWIVPAYLCPKGADKLAIMRVVVKQNLTMDMVSLLLEDIQAALAHFDEFPHVQEVQEVSDVQKVPEVRKVPEDKTTRRARQRWTLVRNVIHSRNAQGVSAWHRFHGDRTHGVC